MRKPKKNVWLTLKLSILMCFSASGQVNWVSGGIDGLSPNTIRLHTLDGWVKAGDKMNLRIGLGGISMISNPSTTSLGRSKIEFWHIGPGGLSYNLYKGFTLEASCEFLFGPFWNEAFLVEPGDIGWVPGIRESAFSRQLSLSKFIPIEDWGNLSFRIGLRACGSIDIYGDDSYLNQNITWVRNYIGRITPYSTGVFAQVNFGLGNWTGYNWIDGSRGARTKRYPKKVRQTQINNPNSPIKNNPAQSKGQITFTKSRAPMNVTNVFVIQGKGQSCEDKEVETAFLELVGSKLLSSYNVLERRMMDVLLSEQKLSMSGLVYEATAVEAGCLQGADGVIFCQYGCLGKDEVLTIKLVDCKTSSQIWVLTAINTSPFEAIEQLHKELK